MDINAARRAIVESWERPFPLMVRRELELPTGTGKVVTVTGVRRCGKTYLLLGLTRQLVERGVPRENVAYVNFDDPRLLPATAQDFELLRAAWRELRSNPEPGRAYLLLDEVQQVDGWELGVRRLYDTGEFEVFVTGSSSRMLSGDIATSLRGRGLSYELLPFSPGEFLAARGLELTPRFAYGRQRHAVSGLVHEYLGLGGFPEVVLAATGELRLRILREYAETMFMRDLVERNGIRNPAAMRELFRFLLANVANAFSANAFWKWLRGTHPMTKRTLLSYVTCLEASGLVMLVRKFSSSLKEQNLRPRKAYLVDAGLRAAYGMEFNQDRGRVLENAVFLALRRLQGRLPLMGVYYWQDGRGREVDFVVTRGRRVRALIQVSADPQAFGARGREVEPLKSALDEFGLSKGFVVTEDHEAEERHGHKTVRFVPFWRWAFEGAEQLGKELDRART